MEERKKLERRITEFLNGTQDDQLLDDIKSSTSINELLRLELVDEVHASILLKRVGEEQLKARLTQQLEESNQVDPINATNKNNWLRWMFLIVGLGLLSVITILFYPSTPETQTQYAYSDPPIPNVRSIGKGEQLDAWSTAMVYYVEKDYRRTVDQLSQLESNFEFMSRHGDNYRLVVAVSSMRLSEYVQANKLLAMISPSSQYYDQALWYQFLCAYELKDKFEANVILERIESYQNHYRASKARRLFDSLIE